MSLTLTTPIKQLPGIGPAKIAAFKRLGITTVDDLLHHFPSGYYFAPPLGGPVVDGQPATVVGTVTSVSNQHGFGAPKFFVRLDSGLGAVWYNSNYLQMQIFKGSRLMLSGVVTGGIFTQPSYHVLDANEAPDPSVLNTVTYSETKGLTSREIGRAMRYCIGALGFTDDVVKLATVKIHIPENQTQVDEARYVLKYDELYYMQLALAVQRAKRATVPPNVKCHMPPQDLTRKFPFTLTNDQYEAMVEILNDMCSGRAMNRLLQGDVGSGKTAVAAYAAILMAFNGGQTAILCPTEILARQHYETFRRYFEAAGVTCTLHVGASKEYDWGDFHTSHILIGTTALLTDGVSFDRLGLVIIDELHKFGVEQRGLLKRHGNPHTLVMSATPIPRTIAMTVFGDLDVSSIKELPPGRKPVETAWLRPDSDENMEGFKYVVYQELAAGHQVYVVCPRIEALDDEMRAVEEVWQEYRNLFPDASVAMLHGQMSPEEKRQAQEWWTGPSPYGRILVSTTVVEVGVDNPNATVMVIEGAERFGLAQLHQLRGRVGRGKDQSYCFLLSDSDSSEARARLRAMEQTNDGFAIAEADLKQRGPGDLLSTRQHGLPELKIADLVEDYDLMLKARDDAQAAVEAGLSSKVQRELEKRYGEFLHLGDTA